MKRAGKKSRKLKPGFLAVCAAAVILAAATAAAAMGVGDTEIGDINPGDINPEEDYYDYVNHETLKEKPIPGDSNGWSYFYELDQDAYNKLNSILAEIVNNRNEYAEGTREQKAADLYFTAMDMEGRKNAGFGALQPYLDEIRSADDIREYLEAIGTICNELGVSSLIAPSYYEDMKDSSRYGCYLNGADLGPGKETLEDDSQPELKSEYREYVKNIMKYSGLGETEAERAASGILEFQTGLAAAALPLAEQNNPEKTYNPLSAARLRALYPNADIMAFIKAAGAESFDNWIVTDPGEAERINEYLTEENLPLLKDYSVFCLIKDFSPYLAPEIRDLTRQWNNTRKGVTKMRSDEKLAGELVQDTFGFEFGRMYVEEYFSEEDKENVEAMVRRIMAAYKDRIKELQWMSAETKEMAVRKLDHMTLKIGYPDQWPDYYRDAVILPADKGSLIDNIVSIHRSARAYEAEEIEGKTDRAQWGMTPQTVNAYYNPLNNEIVFPAAILQPPFYDPEAAYASNLGGIGMVIAHEISHAFDSSGALYDENGNYAMWWTDEDMAEFKKLTQKVERYYDQQEVLNGRCVDGKQTLNENIADLGAISCVTSLVGENEKELRLLFRQYARIWASKYTEESMIDRLNTDVHAPAKVRVNAVLSSTDAFYKAYPELKEGDGMYTAPELRVGIW